MFCFRRCFAERRRRVGEGVKSYCFFFLLFLVENVGKTTLTNIENTSSVRRSSHVDIFSELNPNDSATYISTSHIRLRVSDIWAFKGFAEQVHSLFLLCRIETPTLTPAMMTCGGGFESVGAAPGTALSAHVCVRPTTPSASHNPEYSELFIP